MLDNLPKKAKSQVSEENLRIFTSFTPQTLQKAQKQELQNGLLQICLCSVQFTRSCQSSRCGEQGVFQALGFTRKGSCKFVNCDPETSLFFPQEPFNSDNVALLIMQLVLFLLLSFQVKLYTVWDAYMGVKTIKKSKGW